MPGTRTRGSSRPGYYASDKSALPARPRRTLSIMARVASVRVRLSRPVVALVQIRRDPIRAGGQVWITRAFALPEGEDASLPSAPVCVSCRVATVKERDRIETIAGKWLCQQRFTVSCALRRTPETGHQGRVPHDCRAATVPSNYARNAPSPASSGSARSEHCRAGGPACGPWPPEGPRCGTGLSRRYDPVSDWLSGVGSKLLVATHPSPLTRVSALLAVSHHQVDSATTQ